MNNLLKAEYFFLLLFSIYLFSTTSYTWWVFIVLFLVPDVGMVGYLINPKIGALTYNLTHFFGTAIILILLGVYLANDIAYLTGVIVLGHSALDRLLGFGLKYTDSFKHTHLGKL